MAIPSTTPTKVIALAADDFKRTAFPDGSLPFPVDPPTFTTTKTASSITAVIVEANGATSYNVRVDAGATVSGLTVSGLDANTSYSFQVQGVSTGGTSDWSTAQVVTTDPAGELPFFVDDFESGDLSRTTTADGSTWSWVVTAASVNAEAANGGTFSVDMTFGPDADGADSQSQLNFDFGKELLEAWVEYDLYVPANFVHRTQANPSNNKFFQFNFDGEDYQALTIEFTARGDGTSDLKRFLAASTDPADGSNNWPFNEPDPASELFIGDTAAYTIRTGQWSQVRVHFKSSTDGTTKDGIAELWVNGSLIHSLAWEYWSISKAGRINGGYVMGYSNSGYANATEFRVDNFKCYTSDPGW